MSKPRRRRFTANRESPYQAQVHDDDGRGVYVPDAPASSPAGEDDNSADPDALAARAAHDFTAGESQPHKTLPPAFEPTLTRRRRPLGRRRFTIFRLVGVSALCLGLGLLLGSRLFRRPQFITVAPRADASADPKALTPADQTALDAAYAARAAGNFPDAEARFLSLGQAHPAWQAMLVELGRTRLYAHDLSGAAAALKQAAASGLDAAEANAILGALFKAQRSYGVAEAYFDQAIALDPTEPVYYFFRGECLREEGKVGQATVQFRSALLRNQYETATPLYRLKLWLSEIETGQAKADGTDARLDAALARPDPPMEVLYAAAARDLKAGDTAGALRQVLLARPRTDPGVYQIIINDPVFAGIRKRPELAGTVRLLPNAAPPATTPAGSSLPPASPAANLPAAAPSSPAVPARNP